MIKLRNRSPKLILSIFLKACKHGQRKMVWGPEGWPLGSQILDWVGRNDEEVFDAIFLQGGIILATLSMNKVNVVILGAFLVGLGP